MMQPASKVRQGRCRPSIYGTVLIALILAWGFPVPSVEAGGQGKGRPDKAKKGKGADKNKGHHGNKGEPSDREEHGNQGSPNNSDHGGRPGEKGKPDRDRGHHQPEKKEKPDKDKNKGHGRPDGKGKPPWAHKNKDRDDEQNERDDETRGDVEHDDRDLDAAWRNGPGDRVKGKGKRGKKDKSHRGGRGKGPKFRPPGWDKGKKSGWDSDVPPGK